MQQNVVKRIVTGHNIDAGQHPITEFRDLKNEKGEEGSDLYVDFIEFVCSLSVTAVGADFTARHMFQWIGSLTIRIHGQQVPFINDMSAWALRHMTRDRFGKLFYTDPATVTAGTGPLARTVVFRVPVKKLLGASGQDAKMHATAIKSVRIARDETAIPGTGDVVSATCDINVVLAPYHKTVVPVEVTCEEVDITDLRRIDVEASDFISYLSVLPRNGAGTDTTTVDMEDSAGEQLTDEISFRELNRWANVDQLTDGASFVNEAGASVDIFRLLWEPLAEEDRRLTKARGNSTGFVVKTSAVLVAGDTYVCIRGWARPAKSKEGRKYLRQARGVRNPGALRVQGKNAARKTQPRATMQTSRIPEVVGS